MRRLAPWFILLDNLSDIYLWSSAGSQGEGGEIDEVGWVLIAGHFGLRKRRLASCFGADNVHCFSLSYLGSPRFSDVVTFRTHKFVELLEIADLV